MIFHDIVQPTHLLLLAALIVLGAKRLPSAARQLGMRDFRSALSMETTATPAVACGDAAD